ncbi:MAG: CDP-2,3-bis-(O-geranylgeranyl)-sn-glycerol synthase [archaeon]
MELEITLSGVYWAVNFILPTYAANSVPAIFGGGKSLDFGKVFIDGERIFGSHKTLSGLVSGLLAGTMIAFLEGVLLEATLFPFGVLASVGALAGDLLGAFIKRRLNLSPGYALPLLDQLDFVFGGLCLVSLFYEVRVDAIFLILLVTPIVHLLANVIAYVSKTKDVFW